MVDIATKPDAAAAGPSDPAEDDKDMQAELKLYIEAVLHLDEKILNKALVGLKSIIRTATTSMTSVPKPLKYLAPHYKALKETFEKIEEGPVKKQVADIASVLAMCPLDPASEKELECLKYCLLGTREDIGGWGHEYVHHLQDEMLEQLLRNPEMEEMMSDLIHDSLKFDCTHHSEIQACDFLMEIDRLELLPPYLNSSLYLRVCAYLLSCARYVDELEQEKIYKVVGDQYLINKDWTRALMTAMYTNNDEMVNVVFNNCQDRICLKQLAFMGARQLQNVRLLPTRQDNDEIVNILNNTYLSPLFLSLARELDIMEPKMPDDVYKTWLEAGTARPTVLSDSVDSARQNLSSTFVNALVNAGFGCDNLVSGENGNRWIYRNKEHGMLSATASLGMIHLWDVDGGLTPIDKYLYSNDEMIKAGALLALGIVNCRVRNECDPALALLADFVNDPRTTIKHASVFGLGLAYLGTGRDDVATLLIMAIDAATNAESFSIACLAAGLVCVSTCHTEVTTAILTKLVDWHKDEILKSPHMVMAVLGLGFVFLGREALIDTPCEAIDVIREPYSSIFKSILQMCGYAGTGDVFLIQQMLGQIADRVHPREDEKGDDKKENKDKDRKRTEMDPALAQAVPVLGLGCLSLAEETGTEMCSRLLGSVGRYGDPAVRRAVPLAIAMNSVSKPQLAMIDVLTKYSHDADDKVACNAIFALGVISAGTNNARVAAGLRQLAAFHARNPPELFMVRLAQGLTHMGKGTMTLSPLHSDMQLIDHAAMAGILIPLVALLDPHALILNKHHFLLFSLAAAMQPRWLMTVDETLKCRNCAVRVGTAIDVVGKAGTPKTIAGIHTHTSPVLLASGERAELASDEFESVAPILEGICVLKRKPVVVDMETAP